MQGYNDVLSTWTMPFAYKEKCFIKIITQEKDGEINEFVQNIVGTTVC